MRFTDCIVITGESCKKFDGNKDYISTGAVDVDHIDQNQIESVSYDSKPSRANLMTDDKSILFAKMQGTKKVLLINENLKENIYSTGFFSVAPKNNILNKECLYHLLGSKTFLNQKDKYCSGATQKAITLDGLNKIEINIPKFKEQNQIAKRLDVIKRILDSYDSILKKYDELIKSRFIEMFGDPFNTTKWPVKCLKDISESMIDGSDVNPHYYKTEGEVLFLRIQNVWRNEFRLDDSVYITQEINRQQYYETSLKTGDLLITKIGRYYTKDSSLGRVSVYTGKNDCANYSNNIMRIRLYRSMNSEFVNTLLNLDDYQTYIKCTSKGGTDKRALSKSLIGNYPIITPPKNLQDKFADFVQQVDKSKYVDIECKIDI